MVTTEQASGTQEAQAQEGGAPSQQSLAESQSQQARQPNKGGRPRKYVGEDNFQDFKGGLDRRFARLENGMVTREAFDAAFDELYERLYANDPAALEERRTTRAKAQEQGAAQEVVTAYREALEMMGVPAEALDGIDDLKTLKAVGAAWKRLQGQKKPPAASEEEKPPPPEPVANPGSGPGAVAVMNQSDSQFWLQWGKGEIPTTPENLNRAKRIAEQRKRG